MCTLITQLRAGILFALAYFFVPALAAAQTNEDLLTQAEQAFRRGVENRVRLLQARKQWNEAIDCWLELHDRGVRSPAIYLNLGNAAVLADRWPLALWAYQVGLKLDPNDGQLRTHRDFVRSKVLYPPAGQGRPESDGWPALLYRPPMTVLAIISALAYMLACLGLAIAVFWHRPRYYFVAGLALLIAAGSGFALWRDLMQGDIDRATPLVILMENTTLQRGNGKNYLPHAVLPLLPRGLEARQLHRRGGWAQIRLSSGEIGWVPLANVRVVEPWLQ
jgi:hypothetical protein